MKDDEDSIWTLQAWTAEKKRKKLDKVKLNEYKFVRYENNNDSDNVVEKVENAQARNLLSLMLTKDPKARISMQRALQHAFLTGSTKVQLTNSSMQMYVQTL